MRAILVLLATLALVSLAPHAAADSYPPEAGCDIDDDLYNHCHVGPVHWVTGPACVGVRIGGQADCVDLQH